MANSQQASKSCILTCHNLFTSHGVTLMTRERKLLWMLGQDVNSHIQGYSLACSIRSVLCFFPAHLSVGTELKGSVNSSITSIRFLHKGPLLVSSALTPLRSPTARHIKSYQGLVCQEIPPVVGVSKSNPVEKFYFPPVVQCGIYFPLSF